MLCQIWKTKKVPLLPFLLSVFIFQCYDKFLPLCHTDIYFGGHSWSCFQRIGKRLKACLQKYYSSIQVFTKSMYWLSYDVKVVADIFCSRNNVRNKNRTLGHFFDNAIILRKNDAIRKYFSFYFISLCINV